MPFPGTSVIPGGWDAHHRPVAEGAQTSTGWVYRYNSAGVFNDATGKTEYVDPVPVYGTAEAAAPMRIVRDGVDTRVVIGEREVIQRSYIVTLPVDAGEVLVNDEVRVATASDPLLPGKPLWVRDVRYGSQVWERDLVCDNIPPANR